jgi:hypothetical protein
MSTHDTRWLWPAASFALCIVKFVDAGQPAHVDVSLGGGECGISELTAPAVAGVTVSTKRLSGQAPDALVMRLSFESAGDERRIAALEGVPSGLVEGARVLALRCRLRMRDGTAPTLVMVVFEHDGGVWYRTSTPPADLFGEIRLPLQKTFSRALFASDTDENVRWDQVDRVWIALLIDGPASGDFDVSRAIFTSEPFKPTSPLAISGKWDAAHDRAVRGQIATPNEGPGGGPCMKYAFELPGGRHMYAIPRLPASAEELDGYSALRFTYKADLPEGISGLLVMLIEADGTQYCADRAPPAATDWKTVTIPFGKFHRGGWSADENNRLDLNDVSHIAVGMHGTAKAANASGVIMVSDVQFAP